MTSMMTALSMAAAATILCVVLGNPLPADDERDANASAPSNFLNCANGVGSGTGFNNCSMPQAPAGLPSMPSGVPSGVPSGMPDWSSNMPQPPSGMPQQPPQISQGVDCATAVGQGNGFNNCSNIIQPPSGFFGSSTRQD
ncbi:uncharacterized protein LOC113202009 [Frankliniella occidentalis]|uniref:Uncharacterized protein LOC113202009 n=1 Tax=Frankliniella occidentalis TaxID=133901 RepID=A0A6J1RSD6_FRAOC|nr:uncharacterized protein LOC113202009 [Frankliniella occidentalis]XP_052129166.1 uncharacterized protein LOC113202009 [Frankliniella occidentalis]